MCVCVCVCVCVTQRSDGYGTLASSHRVNYLHHISHMVVAPPPLALLPVISVSFIIKVLTVTRPAAVGGKCKYTVEVALLRVEMAEY